MSDEATVPFGDDPGKTATLLLAAAEELELDPGVVRTTSDQTFVVPAEVAKKAKVDTVDESEPEAADDEPEKKATTKKAAAKKSAE